MTEEGFDPVTTTFLEKKWYYGIRQCCDFIVSARNKCDVVCNEKVTKKQGVNK